MGDITDAESRQKLNKIAGLEEDSKSNDPALNGRAYIVDLLDNER
jgi:hypothetical protein